MEQHLNAKTAKPCGGRVKDDYCPECGCYVFLKRGDSQEQQFWEENRRGMKDLQRRFAKEYAMGRYV